jgi:hypothetical protein
MTIKPVLNEDGSVAKFPLEPSLSVERLEDFKETIKILEDEAECLLDECKAPFEYEEDVEERDHYRAQLKSLQEVEAVADEWIRLLSEREEN